MYAAFRICNDYIPAVSMVGVQQLLFFWLIRENGLCCNLQGGYHKGTESGYQELELRLRQVLLVFWRGNEECHNDCRDIGCQKDCTDG